MLTYRTLTSQQYVDAVVNLISRIGWAGIPGPPRCSEMVGMDTCPPYSAKAVGCGERREPHRSRLMLRAAIAVMVLFFSPVVFAKNEFYKILEKHEKCGELSNNSRIEGCFLHVYRESDNYLNKEYNELVSYLGRLKSKTHKKRFMSAQGAWIKFRDLDCEFYSDNQPIRFNKCRSERTIQRLKELEGYNVPYAMGCNGCPW